ncbi:CcoQ/FixQ family Cbb3-type cytochrome c oxidase assembly chaperone [Marinomonas agarivorans]|nr:CcoQ/FixQ family Cbb3-type cytochrome c oxidase assembly chaperone [Marinomonas agarivorans]
MDINALRAIATVLAFLAFIAVIVWVIYNKDNINEAANIPFADEDDDLLHKQTLENEQK